MNKISAKIVADSICNDNRITTFVLTYPKFIHEKILLHKEFSRNSENREDIPFEKMIQMVKSDPFIPIAWKKKNSSGYITDMENDVPYLIKAWKQASEASLNIAADFNNCFENEDGSVDGVTKQLLNTLLEPFMWETTVLTATEFDNFFETCGPQYKIGNKLFKSKKDARIYAQGEFDLIHPDTTPEWMDINQCQEELHLQILAETMWDARNNSIPTVLQPGEWHIPFGNDIDTNEAISAGRYIAEKNNDLTWGNQMSIMNNVKISTARCSRISSQNPNCKNDIEYHDILLKKKDFTPFEHSAKAMSEVETIQFQKVFPRITENKIMKYFVRYQDGWCNNFKGFIQYRYLIENNVI